MKLFSIAFLINRLRGVKFSFNKKENFNEKLIFFYFTFFKNFNQSSLIKKIINKLSEKTRFHKNQLNEIQSRRIELKNNTNRIYEFKKKILKKVDTSNDSLKKLKTDGYLNVSKLFNVNYKSFYEEVKKLDFYNSQVPLQSDLVERKPNNKFNYFSLRPDIKSINYFFKEFLRNNQLRNIIESYLGSKSYLYSINTMLTKPSKHSHSVTNVHRDYDDRHCLALFIYWTDTAKDDGSTFFIPGSHTNNNKNFSEGIFLEGKRGSVYLIDTFGWHAGNKNLKKDRLVSWLRFSDSQLNTASYDNKEYLFFDYYNSLWS